MTADQQNLYEVLGLSQDATQYLIEQRCIELGEQCRPGKNSGDLRTALLFAQIERAYETLGDPVKRAVYDAELPWRSYKPAERKSASRAVAVVVSMLAVLLILGYAFGYRPYIAQKEEAARIAAEETRRVAEAAAKKAAEESARVIEAEARLAEEKARFIEAQARVAEDRARLAARRADAADLARVEALIAECHAASRASQKTPGIAVGALIALPICQRSERAERDRRRYEALRSEDPAAAAKELEGQRVAREERRRNRPVVTNCTSNQFNTTCVSR